MDSRAVAVGWKVNHKRVKGTWLQAGLKAHTE